MLEWQPAWHCPAQDLGRGEPRPRRPRNRSPPPPDPDHYWGRQGGREVTVEAGQGMQWSSAIVLCCFSIQPAAYIPSSLPRLGHQDERPWLLSCLSASLQILPPSLPSFPSCRPLPSLLVRHTPPPPPSPASLPAPPSLCIISSAPPLLCARHMSCPALTRRRRRQQQQQCRTLPAHAASLPVTCFTTIKTHAAADWLTYLMMRHTSPCRNRMPAGCSVASSSQLACAQQQQHVTAIGGWVGGCPHGPPSSSSDSRAPLPFLPTPPPSGCCCCSHRRCRSQLRWAWWPCRTWAGPATPTAPASSPPPLHPSTRSRASLLLVVAVAAAPTRP